MSASLAPTARPRWAVTAWVDHNNVFVEIPIKDQSPFIAKFPLTPAGLGEALAKMRNYHTIEAGPAVYQVPPRTPLTEPVAVTNRKAMVSALLRQRGIIK
jgi:hypothetical protein